MVEPIEVQWDTQESHRKQNRLAQRKSRNSRTQAQCRASDICPIPPGDKKTRRRTPSITIEDATTWQDLDTDLFSSTPDTLFLSQPVYGKPVILADTTTSPACLDVFRGSKDTLDCDPDLMLLDCIRSLSWEVPSIATSNEIPQFHTPEFDTPSDPQEASITLTNDFPSPMTTPPQEPPPSSTSTSGKTILHILSEQGREDLVPLILQSGACINERNDQGMTALHHAAKNNHAGTVEALLGHQACGSIFNHDGLAAIHLAASNGCIETIQVMLSFGIDLNMKTQRALDEC